jgi:integrase
MGIYQKRKTANAAGSPFWYVYLETTKQRIKTTIPIGETTAQQRDSRKLATALYHQLMNADTARRHHLPTAQPAITFAAYADPYATDVIDHRRGARRERELLAHLIAFFGADLLTAIDRDRVAAYHTARRTIGVAAVTINREVDLLKGMLRDACPKYLTTSPLAGMPKLDVVPPRRRYVSVDEFDRLLAVCADAQDRGILILGRDTLIRLGDLLDLRARDRRGALVTVAHAKTGGSYDAALTPRAAAVLDELTVGADPAAFLFPKFRRRQQPRQWGDSVRQRLEYLCRQADIPYGRTKHGVTFHWGTRRSGATDYVVHQRRPLALIQQQGNWRSPNILLEIYTEVTTADLVRELSGTPMPAPPPAVPAAPAPRPRLVTRRR